MSGETPGDTSGEEQFSSEYQNLETTSSEPLKSESNANKFFDPKSPEMPIEVLGIPTRPLTELGQALGTMAFIDRSIMRYPYTTYGYHAHYSTEHALSLWPLIERVQAGEELKPEDVRPYRKPIKKLVSKLNTVDKLAALSAGVGVGIPARRAINRRIEQEFPERVKPMLDKAKDYLPQAEPYVEFLSQFENPRQQFVNEVSILASNIRRYAREQSQQYDDPEVTAEDAALGMQITIESITQHPDWSEEHLPMFSNLVIKRVPPNTPMPPVEILAIAAPEIIKALDSALPNELRDPGFLRSVQNHPHSKRGLAETFKHRQLYQVNEVANLLFPSIRDLLPESGQEVKDTYEKAKVFFKVPEEEK